MSEDERCRLRLGKVILWIALFAAADIYESLSVWTSQSGAHELVQFGPPLIINKTVVGTNNENDGNDIENNNTSMIIESPLEPRKIYFVHVGKTGGETMRQGMKISCTFRANKNNRRKCYQRFQTLKENGETESELSKQTVGLYHAEVNGPDGSREMATSFLFSLRNPLQRVISWYKFSDPLNCNSANGYVSQACTSNRAMTSNRRKDIDVKDFFTCFPTINDLGLAFWSDSQSQQPPESISTMKSTAAQLISANHSVQEQIRAAIANQTAFNTQTFIYLPWGDKCKNLAIKTINGQRFHLGHMYYNYKFYWDRSLKLFPDKEILAVRTEFLSEDVHYLEDLLSQRPATNETETTSSQHKTLQAQEIPKKVLFDNVTHGSETHTSNSKLSPTSQVNLCCALAKEFEIYLKLLDGAANLPDENSNYRNSKSRSIAFLYEDCYMEYNRNATSSLTSSSFLKALNETKCSGQRFVS